VDDLVTERRFPPPCHSKAAVQAKLDELIRARHGNTSIFFNSIGHFIMDTSQLTIAVLMYFALPLWLVAGFADYLCHRGSNIATTSGPKESMLHLLQFAEMAVGVLAALFLEINALVLLIMLVCFVLHEATALWDLSYASATRQVTPIEQHIHSFLEMTPLMGFVLIAILNWQQFLALFGLGNESAHFNLTLWSGPPSWTYVIVMMGLVLLFEVLPYLEELLRGLRANRGGLVPSRQDRP
jgi:hypothetical protein